MAKDPLGVTDDGLMYVMLNKEYCDTLWKFKERDAPSGRRVWVITPSDDFEEWAHKTLRKKFRIRPIEIPPTAIIGGAKELERRQKNHIHFQMIRRAAPDKPVPQTLKRWTITFEDEIDGMMFKLKWL